MNIYLVGRMHRPFGNSSEVYVFPADEEFMTLKVEHLYPWGWKALVSDPRNSFEGLCSMRGGGANPELVRLLRLYFGLSSDIHWNSLWSDNPYQDAKFSLGVGDMVIEIYQRSLASVFEEKGEKLVSPEDFLVFRSIKVEVHKLPEWARRQIDNAFPRIGYDRFVKQAIQIDDNTWIALLNVSYAYDNGIDGDWFYNSEVYLLKKDHPVQKAIYSTELSEELNPRIDRIHLSQSKKSLVIFDDTRRKNKRQVLSLANILGTK